MTQMQFNESVARNIGAGLTFGQIRTRDGFPVRILSYDVKGRYPVAGVVMLGEDEYVRQWTIEGKGDYRPNVRTNYDLVIEVEGGEGCEITLADWRDEQRILGKKGNDDNGFIAMQDGKPS